MPVSRLRTQPVFPKVREDPVLSAGYRAGNFPIRVWNQTGKKKCVLSGTSRFRYYRSQYPMITQASPG